jgi:hypothetical protein
MPGQWHDAPMMMPLDSLTAEQCQPRLRSGGRIDEARCRPASGKGTARAFGDVPAVNAAGG